MQILYCILSYIQCCSQKFLELGIVFRKLSELMEYLVVDFFTKNCKNNIPNWRNFWLEEEGGESFILNYPCLNYNTPQTAVSNDLFKVRFSFHFFTSSLLLQERKKLLDEKKKISLTSRKHVCVRNDKFLMIVESYFVLWKSFEGLLVGHNDKEW